MAKIINCVTKSGKHVNYVDEIIGAGTMKNVYFSSDKSYVIAFYQKTPNQQARERIEMITGSYYQNIFNQQGGDYWHEIGRAHV